MEIAYTKYEHINSYFCLDLRTKLPIKKLLNGILLAYEFGNKKECSVT